MDINDNEKKYGWLSKLFHWIVAFSVIGLFALGYWMRTLDYYSSWYQTAPHYHESIGIILFIIMPIFILWRLKNKNPSNDHLKPYEKLLASLMKKVLYLTIIAILVTGYLISSAGDTPVNVFDIFSVPALFTVDDSKVFIGNLHEYFAYFIIGLTVLHAAAALKHHFVDKDNTLRRMLPFFKLKE